MMQRYRVEKIDRVRELAMQVLQKVHVEGAYANVALAETLRETQLTERDRRFLTELVYGVTKAGETLDYMIGRYVADIRKAQPAIRELLRLGFYQIFLMCRVPPSAAFFSITACAILAEPEKKSRTKQSLLLAI